MFWGHGNNLLRCKNNKEALNRRESSPYIIRNSSQGYLQVLKKSFTSVAKLNLRFFYLRGTE